MTRRPPRSTLDRSSAASDVYKRQSFEGEPKLVAIPDDMDEFAELLWNSLNEDNKVSLFVRYIDIETGKYESKIINKNK